MSELLKKIKDAALQARKSRNSNVSAPLITLIGDIEAVGKNDGREVIDLDVTKLLKKYIKNANDTAIAAEKHSNTPSATTALAEVSLYESFLPSQLTEDQLRKAIEALIEDFTKNAEPGRMKISIGWITKELKAAHDGTYDGATAARMIKEILQ